MAVKCQGKSKLSLYALGYKTHTVISKNNLE